MLPTLMIGMFRACPARREKSPTRKHRHRGQSPLARLMQESHFFEREFPHVHCRWRLPIARLRQHSDPRGRSIVRPAKIHNCAPSAMKAHASLPLPQLSELTWEASPGGLQRRGVCLSSRLLSHAALARTRHGHSAISFGPLTFTRAYSSSRRGAHLRRCWPGPIRCIAPSATRLIGTSTQRSLSQREASRPFRSRRGTHTAPNFIGNLH